MNSPFLRLSFLLCILVLAAACGRHEKAVSIDSKFQPIYNEFLADGAAIGAPQSVDDLVIEFGDPQKYGCAEESAGCCLTGEDQTPTIVISKSVWDKYDFYDRSIQLASGTSKTILLYHELGHCVLGRGHDDEMNPDNPTYGGTLDIPASLMETRFSSYLPGLFDGYRSEYVKELFGKGPGPNPFGSNQ